MTIGEAQKGRILRGVGGFYTVLSGETEYTLRARGRFRKEGMTPLVGDVVLFSPGEGKTHGWIDEILPRTSRLLRPPAANVSLLALVIAPEPTPDLLLIDRMLVYAAQSNFEAILCVNKCDMDASLAEEVCAQYKASGVSVYATSAETGEGLPRVRERMIGELCCMAGQSAVGKSTLLNALCGLSLKTGDISERNRRGKHTTRHAELLYAAGLQVLDTPGFSLFSLESGMPPEALPALYPEYAALAGECRFAPCLHDKEPGCAVREAVACGRLDAERHGRYTKLLEEVRQAWKDRYT